MDLDVLEELILNVNARTGIKSYILEKDYYVCLVLKELSKMQNDFCMRILKVERQFIKY